MDRILIILFALAGLSNGLQAPLLYKYKYYGSISTGIPELSSQAAAWAMKANIEVYIEKNDGVAVFDVNDFRMVEFNDKLGCDSRGEIPDELFHPADDAVIANAVESTFKVHLFNFEDFAIEDDSTNVPWLTNMRKGVASIFKNEILRGNIDSQVAGTVAEAFHKGHAVHVFTLTEETLFGLCKVDYTVSLIPEYLAGNLNHELEQHIEQDIQRDQPNKSSPYTGKTSKKSSKKSSRKKTTKTTKTGGKYTKPDAPELKDDLWHVVRSIDFDHCDELVAIQSTPIGINGVMSVGQYDWARARSSVTDYIYRGSPGHARLERAIVEGATSIAPFGMKTELLQARANQTLTLVGVTSLGNVPSLPVKCEQSKTWMYSIKSFAPPPKISKPHPWVEYTGKGAASFRNYQLLDLPAYTDKEFDTMKSNIVKYITKSSLLLTDMDQEETRHESEPEVLEILGGVAELFAELSKEEILHIFDKFFEKDLQQNDVLARKLVVDAAASSGSFFAYDAILDYIKQDKIPDLQVMTIFMSLANNAKCPSNIPALLDYVLSLNIKEKPFLTATVLINFAELVHQLCIEPNTRNVHYAGPVFGDMSCNGDLIKSRIVPYLSDMIYSDSTTWEKDVALEVARALGSSFSFPLLSPVIEGKIGCSNRVRSLAIYALASWKLTGKDNFKKPIMDLLTEVYMDIGEDSEVREAALITLVSWGPEPNFWHTLARSTWREPSKQFSTFASSLIHSFANFEHPFYLKQNQAALHAFKLTKPVAPSEKYSLVYMMTKRLIEKHVTKFETFQLHKNDHGFNEREFYYFLMTNLGGFEYVNLELFTITDGFFKGYMDVLQAKQEKGGAEGVAAKIAQKFYEEVQDTIRAQTIPRDTPNGGIFLKMFDHMSLYLPLNIETISTTQFASYSNLVSFAIELGLGYDLVLGKFFRPINVYNSYPTELGLPLIGYTAVSMVISEASFSKLSTGGQKLSIDSLKKLELSVESLVRFSSLGSTGLFSLLPWNSKQFGVGIISTRDFTLPIKGLVRNDQREDGGHHNILHLELQSLYKNEFPILKASNIPYTVIMNIVPIYDREGMSFRPIHTTPPISESMPFTIPRGQFITGISTQLKWKSDIGLHVALFNLYDFVSNPRNLDAAPWLIYALASPTVKYWYIQLIIQPQYSDTKNVTIEIVTGTYGKPELRDDGQITQETGGDFSQYGQDSYSQYDQESFDVEQGFQEIGGQDEIETLNHINYGDSFQQRSQKMQGHFGGTAYTKSIKIDFNGDRHRSYELVLSFAKSKISNSRKVTKSQISLIRSPVPLRHEKPASLCLDIQKSMPAFSKLDTVEDLLAANLDKDIKIELTLNCKGKPILEARGKYSLSDIRVEKLRSTIPKACDFDQYNPLYTLHSHAVYDDIKLSIGYEQFCERFGNHLPICHSRKELGIELHRCPVRETWRLSGKPLLPFYVDGIPNNNLLNYAFAVGKRKNTVDFYPDHYSTFNLESDKCVIGDHSVRTFDGFTYAFEPSDCWTVAAKDCSVEKGRTLLVRASKGELSLPDVKYIDVSRGLVIELTSNVVLVNGKQIDPIGEEETVKDDEGKFIVSIHKKHDFYMAKFSRKFYILAKNNKIKIHLPDTMRGLMCGLCGNFDGEPEAEFVGPHRCFYSDPKLFSASWSAESDTCNLYDLLPLREKAEKFQESCHTIDNLYNTCPHFNARCFQVGFKLLKKGTMSCISANPVPYCANDCEIAELIHQAVEFRCWPDEHAPINPDIKALLDSGAEYTGSPVKEDAYYEHVVEDVVVASTCKKY